MGHIPFAVSGANPIAYHFFHLLFYSLCSSLIFLVVFTLSKSTISGLVASLGFTFTTATDEVWNRLGPQEPYLIFFLLIFLYNLVRIHHLTEAQNFPRKKVNIIFSLLISLLALFLATFTKETTVAVIPALILLIILSILATRKITRFVQATIVITLSEIINVILLFFVRSHFDGESGYTSQLSLSKEFLIKNFYMYKDIVIKDTGWFLPLAIFMFLIILIKKSRDLRHETSMFKVFCLFFFALSASFLIIQLPWFYVLGRYLPPVFMALFIFIGCSLSYYFSIIRRLKKSTLGRTKVLGHFLYFAFIIYSLIFFYFQVKEVAKEIANGKEMTLLHSDMVKNLAKNLGDKKKIYFIINEGAFEYAYETGLHLDLFYKKKIEIEHLNPNLLPPLVTGDLIVVSRQFQEIPDNIINQILSRKSLLYTTYLWNIYKIEK